MTASSASPKGICGVECSIRPLTSTSATTLVLVRHYAMASKELSPSSGSATYVVEDHVVYRAWSESVAVSFWMDDSWDRCPHPADHSNESVRTRTRRHAFIETTAASLLCPHPRVVPRTSNAIWSLMLCRYIRCQVHDNSIPLSCSESTKPKDRPGDQKPTCATRTLA